MHTEPACQSSIHCMTLLLLGPSHTIWTHELCSATLHNQKYRLPDLCYEWHVFIVYATSLFLQKHTDLIIEMFHYVPAVPPQRAHII